MSIRYGDPSVVAAAMSTRGEAGRTDLRDILRPWSDGLVTILRRADDVPAEEIAHALVGYVLYRIVFLQEEIADAELVVVVDRIAAITVRNGTDA